MVHANVPENVLSINFLKIEVFPTFVSPTSITSNSIAFISSLFLLFWFLFLLFISNLSFLLLIIFSFSNTYSFSSIFEILKKINYSIHSKYKIIKCKYNWIIFL